MTSKEIEERFKELNSEKEFTCTSKEMEDFVTKGLIIKFGSDYKILSNMNKKVNVMKDPNYKMNLDLSNIISLGLEESKKSNYKRIYILTQKDFDKLNSQNRLFIYKNEYYLIEPIMGLHWKCVVI